MSPYSVKYNKMILSINIGFTYIQNVLMEVPVFSVAKYLTQVVMNCKSHINQLNGTGTKKSLKPDACTKTAI